MGRTVAAAGLLASAGFASLAPGPFGAAPVFACSYASAPDPMVSLEHAAVILTARVTEVRQGELVRLDPEGFLKGPVETELVLHHYDTTCDLAAFNEGDRVLVFLPASETGQWPQSYSTYYLRGGFAENALSPEVRQPESSVVEDIRALTGQYAVPVSETEDAPGIDWGKTVLPVSAIVGVVFGVGLVLMRIWHRIDPS